MKRNLLLLSLAMAISSIGLGQVPARTEISLNGWWQTVADPFDYFTTRPSIPSKNRMPANKTERIEFGFSNVHRLFVPGDWNTQDPTWYLYEGTMWYKRDFLFAKKPGTRSVLRFEAVNYEADVFLNGTRLGSHAGGFTPFEFDCTDLMREGKNFVVVRVNNDRKAERVPAMDFDWWNYGGITRDARLITIPTQAIREYVVRLDPSDTSRIEGWVAFDSSFVPNSFTISVGELSIRRVIQTKGLLTVPFSFKAKPQRWSPERPKLYDVTIETDKDLVTDRIGFKTIGTQGTQILLNGEPIFLRGICLHEEALFTGGRISNESQIRELFEVAKEMNCNYLRLAHYAHSEAAVRLADEMGFLIWAEVPVWQNIAFNSPAATSAAQQQLKETIVRDRNRASIGLWSVSNETDADRPGRLAYLVSMIQLARSLDPTRLMTTALSRQMVDDTTMLIADSLGQYLDVLALNEYIGWYEGLPDKCLSFRWKTIYDKPHIVSEFGGEALYGFHGDSLTVWSEEYQADLYNKQIAMFKRIPFLAGVSPWILKDFRSPRRLNPDYQEHWNRKGLISNQGEKKQAFYIMQDWYPDIKKQNARPK